MRDLTIMSHRGPYPVRFGPAFDGIADGLAAGQHLVIDSRVADLYAGALAAPLASPSTLRIEATEANKSLERMADYVLHLLEHGIRRDHTLVAVGGGIIQDIVCFMAATLLRGLPWTFHPTTLLAQADSCIGSKSSINVGRHKNQLGTFTPPADILISTDVLDTLDPVDLRSGLGEVIKVHVLSGWEDTRRLLGDYQRLVTDRALLQGYIRRSLEIKKALIEIDEFDQGDRLILNYGHTFGHAIESCTRFAVPHGIAVTIGMDMANFAAWRLGLAERQVYDEIHPVLAANYAGFERAAITTDDLVRALGKDKKNIGRDVVLILPREPGMMIRHQVTDAAKLRTICDEFLVCLRGDAARS